MATRRLIISIDLGRTGAIAALVDGAPGPVIDMPLLDRRGERGGRCPWHRSVHPRGEGPEPWRGGSLGYRTGARDAAQEGAGRKGGSQGRSSVVLQLQGMQMPPSWAVDPARAANDADKPHDNPEIAVDTGTPDELRWVDRALASMGRQCPLRALTVRTEFTVSASQAVKARLVAEQYGGVLTLRR